MANTELQRAGAAFSAVSSASATFPGACTSGSRIVVTVVWESTTATLSSVADGVNAGNYTVDKTDNNGGSGTGRGSVAIASIANGSASALTITATFSGSTTGRIDICELNNSASTPAFDSSGSATDPFGVSPLSMSITTLSANCSVFCGALHYDNTAVTQDSGYTQRYNAAGSASYESTEDNVDAGAAGAKTLTFGSSGDKQYAIVAAAYTAPTGGGGGSTILMGQAVF